MRVVLDAGYYANLFEVVLKDSEVAVVACERSKFPDLRELRERIREAGQNISVYAPGHSDTVFGYGRDLQWLRRKGFASQTVAFQQQPQLTGRIVLDGIVAKARSLGYAPSFEKKGRCKLFNWSSFQTTASGEVRVFKGYDTRVFYLEDEAASAFTFNLVVDMCFAFRDGREQPLNFRDISARFPAGTVGQVRRIQGDLVPTGINTEISRQRLLDSVVPFVRGLGEFDLPCGGKAEISASPLRIVVGAQDGIVW